MRVAIFVGTRADLGPLEPVIRACDDRPDIDTHVLCAVALDCEALQQRLVSSIEFSGDVHELAPPLDEVTRARMLEHGAQITDGLRLQQERTPFDVLVVLGDRWELLYVVSAAFLLGVRIVHIHGGEVTEGAIDERIRHAVTKLADRHCVASEDAAARIRQMGEPPQTVLVTGAPGLDRLIDAPALTDAALAELVGQTVVRPLALFTYHPPTAVADAPVGKWATEALRATLEHCGTVIATDPGIDEGREEILRALREVARKDDRVRLVSALGPAYPSVLSVVDVVVGNSSSGVIEAATVHVPSVDIGDRQAGRLRAASVIHADESRSSVSEAVAIALRPETRQAALEVSNPYGDGHAAARIAAAVESTAESPRAKKFHELQVTR